MIHLKLKLSVRGGERGRRLSCGLSRESTREAAGLGEDLWFRIVGDGGGVVTTSLQGGRHA